MDTFTNYEKNVKDELRKIKTGIKDLKTYKKVDTANISKLQGWMRDIPKEMRFNVTYTEVSDRFPEGVSRTKAFKTKAEADEFLMSQRRFTVTYTENGISHTRTFKSSFESTKFIINSL